jgi:hypothetical protein
MTRRKKKEPIQEITFGGFFWFKNCKSLSKKFEIFPFSTIRVTNLTFTPENLAGFIWTFLKQL